MRTFLRLNGKQKFLALMAVIGWGLSIYFSQIGFSVDNKSMAWVGWLLGFIITAVELAFNDRGQKQTLSLIFFGVICYGYGIWSNVTGFWSIQNPNTPFPWFTLATVSSWFVGLMLEVLPEPLFMFALGRARESDPLGALSDAFSGYIDDAKGGNGSGSSQNQNTQQVNTKYTPEQYRNAKQGHNEQPSFSQSARDAYRQQIKDQQRKQERH
jgi:hypothetical protein